MKPATGPRADVRREGLLVIDPGAGRFVDVTVADLPSQLRRGDLVVVNDAATLPASFRGRARGEPVEIRLAALHAAGTATVVLLGPGDFRTDTDLRPPPPHLYEGEALELMGGARAVVDEVSPASPRLVRLRLAGGAHWATLAYAQGAPVQYAYVQHALPLGRVQTPYAAEPWAVEMPSAGRALSFSVMRALAARGVRLSRLTHAAGLSATGDATLDRLLPFPERFAIPAETARLIVDTQARGGRVVAVGTTVVRALEGAAQIHGEVRAGQGVTDLVLDASFRPRVVDGVLSGMHDRGTSHARLLSAFAPPALLDAALAHADAKGYLVHEFGDHLLVLSG